MRTSHWSTCLLAGAFVLSGLVFDARAADKVDPTGTYTWERSRRNSDEKIKSTLTLKLEGHRLTGTMTGGRGGPIKIENGKISKRFAAF